MSAMTCPRPLLDDGNEYAASISAGFQPATPGSAFWYPINAAHCASPGRACGQAACARCSARHCGTYAVVGAIAEELQPAIASAAANAAMVVGAIHFTIIAASGSAKMTPAAESRIFRRR